MGMFPKAAKLFTALAARCDLPRTNAGTTKPPARDPGEKNTRNGESRVGGSGRGAPGMVTSFAVNASNVFEVRGSLLFPAQAGGIQFFPAIVHAEF